MGNHLDRPEIREALKEGSGSIIRRSSTMQMETYYLAVLMPDGMIFKAGQTKRTVRSRLFCVFCLYWGLWQHLFFCALI